MNFDYEEYKTRHEKAQAKVWRGFAAELKNLQSEYSATKTEIIDGLSVTRSKFYDFEKDPEVGLNINRSHVLNLWAYLCDARHRKKISKTAIEQREKLRADGPNHLLKSAGFASEPELSSLGGKGMPTEHPQIRRVLHRLNSGWIYDDAVRVYITNKILDQVLDLGQPASTIHMKHVPLSDVLKWPEGEPLKSVNARVNEKYQRAVKKLILSGKTEFVSSELFELYQSIFEHNEIGIGGNSRLHIVDCQFRALSQSLSDLSTKAIEPSSDLPEKFGSNLSRDSYFEDISKEAERNLVDLLLPKLADNGIKQSFVDEYNSLDLVETPCLEAKIGYQVTTKDGIKSASIRYSSTSTHVENMLIAMKHGLGYSLGISGFSVRATGRTEKSLARISLALSKAPTKALAAYNDSEKIDSVYEGWWVTSNTIIGILNAAADAVTRWLDDERIDVDDYYNACIVSAEFSQKFYELRKGLYEYTPHAANSINDNFGNKAQNLIQEIRGYLERHEHYQSSNGNGNGFQIHFQKIKNQRDMSSLMLSHLALIMGKPLEADKELLRELGSNHREAENNPFSCVLSVYATACEMAYQLVSGDQSFIVGKRWKYEKPIEAGLEKLGSYIKEVGSIDFDVYLVISQLFGTIGVLDFYSNPNSDEPDVSSYTGSVDLLLQAAHYSLRIGHTRRASQWLSFASRMCTRLGDKTKAMKLYNTASLVSGDNNSLATDHLFRVQRSELESNWSGISHSLAGGEINMLQNNNDKALETFLKALDVALRAGYGRIIPDCLYNVAQSAQQLANTANSQTFQGRNPFAEWEATKLEEWKKKFDTSAHTEIVYPILKDFLVGKDSKDFKLSQLSVKSRTATADIWNCWCSNEKGHPYAEQVIDGTFLQSLSAR